MESLKNELVTRIQICEVCDTKNPKLVFSLGEQPLCDDLKLSGSSADCAKYPINILLCDTCMTAHQEFQIDKTLLFHSDYHYRAKLTKDVLSGMEELVSHVKDVRGSLDGLKVLDIGCNDGSLLDFFAKENAITFGIEPTQAIQDCSSKHQTMNAFFDKNVAEEFLNSFGKPDVICFTNVFAHISDLNGLIDNLNSLITDKTLLVIENHYLGSVVESFQFDTFYHEHPRTYSLSSFLFIAKKLGMEVIDYSFPKRYGGNVRVVISRDVTARTYECSELDNVILKERELIASITSFDKRLTSWKNEKRSQINEFKSQGLKIAGKAFPGRASIVINALGLTENDIPVILEQHHSPKVGFDVPGTKIKIIVEENPNDYDILINFAWHIHCEISAHMKDNGFQGTLIPII